MVIQSISTFFSYQFKTIIPKNMLALYVSLWTDVSTGQIPRRTVAQIMGLSINNYWWNVFPRSLAVPISPAVYQRALSPASVAALCMDLAWTLRHSLALSIMDRHLSLASKTLRNMNSIEHLSIIPPYCSVLQKPFILAKVIVLFLKPNLSFLIS